MDAQSQYEKLGIDPHKGAVKKSFRGIIDNEIADAFCNIVTDPFDNEIAFTQHMDGDGSKFVQRVLHYNETGDAKVFRGAADDALSMNTGDIAACGFVDRYVMTDVININSRHAPKDIIMEQLAIRFGELKSLYKDFGMPILFLGGETADLPDQVRTVAFDVCVSSRIRKDRLIAGNVQPGDVIYGLSSAGKLPWEQRVNSGLMSNGLTAARIKLMSQHYGLKYPELMRADGKFEGRFSVKDKPSTLRGMTVSDAILSPTRQWAIVIKLLLNGLEDRGGLNLLHGIVMNTGGGATKILNIGKHICYEKEMPKPPPIFELIQGESKEIWKNMYVTFNCGIGIDIVGSSEGGILEETLRELNLATGINIFRLGECRPSAKPENEVKLETLYGEFSY